MRRVLLTASLVAFPSIAWGADPPPAPASPPASSSDTPPPAPAAAPPPTAEAPPPGNRPPPEYYVETPPTGGESPAPTAPPPRVRVSQSPYEPPPPGYAPVYEPPPPPVPRHTAPRTSLWLGARLGWFFPFGNVYARGQQFTDATGYYGYTVYRGVAWRDYASSGPMFEVDAGARLGRNYNVFLLWERAQLGGGDAETELHGDQEGADSDFWGVGLRASSDPDRVGFVTEIALGYRRARATWSDGTELQFTDGVLEGRIGLGADIRLSPSFSLSPMLTLGVGSFGSITRKFPNGSKVTETSAADESDSHAWLTLQLGGHFDLFGAH